MPSRETLEALQSDEFLAGLALGFGALTVGVLIVYVWRQWRNDPAGPAGLLSAVAAAVALSLTSDVDPGLWIGIGLLALGGAIHPVVRGLPGSSAILAIPGAWWVARQVELPGAEWVSWLLLLWIVVAASLVSDFDLHFADRGYGPVLMAISIAGMFVTLPDTEEVLVVLGAVLPVTLLAWPRPLTYLGPAGAYPLLGIVAWVIAEGGRGRESSVVGAAACLGFLALEPVVRHWRGRTFLDRSPARWWLLPLVMSCHLGFVLVAARVAGLADTPERAALVVAGAAAVTIALLATIGATVGPGHRRVSAGPR